MNIIPGDRWGNPRVQAARANAMAQAQVEGQRRITAGADPHDVNKPVPWHPGPPQASGWYGSEWQHGRSPEETTRLRDRFEQFVPKLVSKAGGAGRAQEFFEGIMPPGANLAPNAGAGYRQASRNHADMRRRVGTGGYSGLPSGAQPDGGNIFQQTQAPYQPEFSSPDRQSYPVNRNLANIYWRLFYKLDHIAGSGVDLFAELPWGDVDFTGEGLDGEIKDTCEQMWEDCKVRSLLPFMVREYLVTGEIGIHNYYDQSKGRWSYVALHNPDQLEVIYTPFIKMDPIVRFKPDNRLQQVLASSSPMLTHVRESIPPDLLSALMGGQSIELHPLNFTFLPRRMHPYDVRGTSIFSRMWRIFMLEDAVYNASIAVARRASSPLKVAKLGDSATGWIPDPSHEAKLHELLAAAELDPTAWLVYHYGINFDLVGVQERTWKIETSSEFIDKVKLMALGLSKGFLWGEVTYASAQSGLTVFLQRLLALREFIESDWIIPKFFRPIAVMRRWVKPTPAELAHGVRTRRSHQEVLDDRRYITPTLDWARKLEPSIDQAKITAVQALSTMGIVFSKQYLASIGNADWEEQLNQRGRETEIEKEIMKKFPALATLAPPGGEGGAGGGGGMGMMPGLPPESMGEEPVPPGEGGGEPPAPPEAGIHASPGDQGGPGGGRAWKRPEVWAGGRYESWEAPVVADLLSILDGDQPEEDLWARMLKTTPQLRKAADGADFWEGVKGYLVDEGYPPKDIVSLEDILKYEGVLQGMPAVKASDIDALESDDALLLAGVPRRR